MRLFGCLANLLSVSALVLVAGGLLWLFLAYDRVFSVTAATEVLALQVSGGTPLQWPVGGGRTACDEAQPVTLPEGTLLALAHPVKLSVRIERSAGKDAEEFVVFQFEPFEAGANPPPLALHESSTGPGRPLAATVICLGLDAIGAGLSLPLRGSLELGADIAPSRSQMLHDGEASLLEAPSGRLGRILDLMQGSYQLESDHVVLRLGDKVLLPSQGGCASDQDDCLETQGFLRLARPADGNPMLLRVRAVTTSHEVEIVRPSQQITRLRPSFVRRFTNDPWVAAVLSIGIFMGGFAWLLIELMNLLRTHPPTPPVDGTKETSSADESRVALKPSAVDETRPAAAGATTGAATDTGTRASPDPAATGAADGITATDTGKGDGASTEGKSA